MDFTTALQCANLSQEIYRAEFSSTNSSEKAAFTSQVLPKASSYLLQDTGTDTQFSILEDLETGQTTIVFRGSENDKDWETNLRVSTREQSWQKKAEKAAEKAAKKEFRKEMKEVAEAVVEEEALVYPKEYGKPSRPVRMHQGFIDAYLSVRDRVHEHVQSSASHQYRITGHSLGGAIATLCAVDLQYNFDGKEGRTDPKISSLEVYTFGSPRVGNGAFSDSYNQRVSNTWRIVNGWDAVVGLPAPWQGYRHVEKTVKLARKFTWKIVTGSFNDHKISSYISALGKQL